MKEWQGVCTHHNKGELGHFLKEILFYGQMLRQKKSHTESSAAAAFRRAKEMAAETPVLIVTDIKDEEGNYLIVDGETGEITPYVAVEKTMKGATTWTAAYYIEEPKKKQKEAFREESLF